MRNRENRVATQVKRLWDLHADVNDFDGSFLQVAPDLMQMLEAEQASVAQDAVNLTKLLMDNRPSAWNAPTTSWQGINGNGMTLMQTMYESIIEGKQAVKHGVPPMIALQRSGLSLVIRSRTLLSDTYRSASETTARGMEYYAGYVRALCPPSCGRCVILAGKPSGKEPFERHPLCDCIAVWGGSLQTLPATPTNPTDYLDDLDDEQLAHVLGSKANARAYRAGADLNQLVNAYRRKGAVRTAQMYGRGIKYTTEGVTKRAFAARRMMSSGYAKEYVKNGGKYIKVDRPRMMPETIFRVAGDDQAKAREMLYKYGWIR